jgi:hypothetical protein
MENVFRKIARIGHQDIPAIAAEGVERAMAARSEKLRELSEAELTQVSGGALSLKLELINGGRMELMKATNMNANVLNPAFNAGNLAGMPGAGVAGF